MSKRRDEAAELVEEATRYWRTSIIDVRPGKIALRGYPIQELIGHVTFPQVVWLMLRGELPDPPLARLLEAALVASVDHGPQAPSISIARSAVTCGLPLNGALASAVNTLDDVHGGAGEQALAMYGVVEVLAARAGLESAVAEVLKGTAGVGGYLPGGYLPGFGHRFHPVDPRALRLLDLVDEAARQGVVTGRFANIARALEAGLERQKGRRIPLNIDGASAVVFGELGFQPPLARALFCISRSVGILAHAWEQQGRGERNKGPMPRKIPYAYEGVPERHLDSK